MPFLSYKPDIKFERPMAGMVIANTMLSTIPGVSAAGFNPEATLITPALDAGLILNGMPKDIAIPLSPTGCATPATVTRAMFELCRINPVIINAGLTTPPAVPCIDAYGSPGRDPREGPAVPEARALYEKGITIGRQLSDYSDLLVLGESVPGGTTTALCVLRALGYDVGVSSSYSSNPSSIKEEICTEAARRIAGDGIKDPLDIVSYCGDPMMPVVAGIAKGYDKNLVLSGGTQMLAVEALIKALGNKMPPFVTTEYVRVDSSANIEKASDLVGATAWFVDPDFGNIGNAALARYCNGEVKEGALISGSLWLAYMMGYSKEEIWKAINSFFEKYG
jgi:uncharacterized protein (TIGR00303 family)